MTSRYDRYALSAAGIAEQNADMLQRYRDFRRAADAVVAAWREFPQVQAVSLLGSLAVAPYKEVPRFSPYRRKRVEIWHEVGDLDLALWLAPVRDLNGLRRAKDLALRELSEQDHHPVASHHTDVFVLEPDSDRYLGRLCNFNRCPKGKLECHAPGCGDLPHLKQHLDFVWRPDSLAKDRSVRLFDRATGTVRLAAELPLPEGTPDG